jgi:hypothetical protein
MILILSKTDVYVDVGAMDAGAHALTVTTERFRRKLMRDVGLIFPC